MPKSKKPKNVVAGNDLALSPVQVVVTNLEIEGGEITGYAVSVQVPIPENLGPLAQAKPVDTSYTGKGVLKKGTAKIRSKALKQASKTAKDLKAFWDFRHKELKALSNEGKPPRKPRTPKTPTVTA